jgi:hypothetical protein
MQPSRMSPQATPAQAPKPPAAPATIVYSNTQYGFCFVLPASWKGLTIVTERWAGDDFSSGQTVHGPLLRIRHPKWTAEQPYQDIPIMVFTPAQWELVEKADMSVSAAPIGPAKLGQNSHYVFALPPRWTGFTDDLGWRDLEAWMEQNRLQAPCGNKPAPITPLP